MFMVNNTFYLLQQLAPEGENKIAVDVEVFQLDQNWFREKVKAIFTSEKGKYLAHWEHINSNLTSIDAGTADGNFHYQNKKKGLLLSREHGQLFKNRFRGFNETFTELYNIHKNLTVVNPTLRKELQGEVKKVFLKRYEKFYDKYSKLRFSKKKQNEYLQYPPGDVDTKLNSMYKGGLLTTQEEDVDSD